MTWVREIKNEDGLTLFEFVELQLAPPEQRR
jgi:hypothetical protein